MIDKNHIIKRTDFSASEIEPFWDDALNIAEVVLSRMPDIGFMSRSKRLNAFFVCCENIERILVDNDIDENAVAISILIMRFSNKKFDKAHTMFQILVMQNKINILHLGELAYKIAMAMNPRQ